MIIEIKNHRSQQLGRYAAPVLKRFLDEVGDGQHQPAQVPCSYRYIRERDLFDLSEFAFDNHDVVDEQRLGQRDLNSCEHIAERLLRREPENDACDSSRGKNAGAELPHRIEQHQDRTGRDDHHCGDNYFANHRDLRVNPASEEIILCIHSVPAQECQLHGVDSANDQDRQRDDQENAECLLRYPNPILRQFQQRQQKDDAEQRHQQSQGMTKDRHDHFAEQTVRPFRPQVHPFFDCPDRAENEPEHSDDPSGVKNCGERTGPENSSRTGNNAGDDRHQGKAAAAH